MDVVAVLDVSATRVAAPFNHRRRSSRPHPVTSQIALLLFPLVPFPNRALLARHRLLTAARHGRRSSLSRRAHTSALPRLQLTPGTEPSCPREAPEPAHRRPKLPASFSAAAPMAAVALLSWSSLLRPPSSRTDPPNRFHALQRCSLTPPRPYSLAGAPPPPAQSAAGRPSPRTSRLGPPLPLLRPPAINGTFELIQEPYGDISEVQISFAELTKVPNVDSEESKSTDFIDVTKGKPRCIIYYFMQLITIYLCI